MTRLVVRKIPWDFDATVPFLWQPGNPNFGLFCNAFTYPELEQCYEEACRAYDQLITSSRSNSTRPISPTWRLRSPHCSKSFWTIGIHCSVAEIDGWRR